jgi:hypothetical protein
MLKFELQRAIFLFVEHLGTDHAMFKIALLHIDLCVYRAIVSGNCIGQLYRASLPTTLPMLRCPIHIQTTPSLDPQGGLPQGDFPPTKGDISCGYLGFPTTLSTPRPCSTLDTILGVLSLHTSFETLSPKSPACHGIPFSF